MERYPEGGFEVRRFRPNIVMEVASGVSGLCRERLGANALGQFSPLLTSHPVYLALGAADHARRVADRSLFRPHLDPETPVTYGLR